MKKIIECLAVMSGAAMLCSCQEEDFGYKPYAPDKAVTEYSARFINRDDVNVSIETETPGAPFFVYFENPFNAEGEYNGATAYLQGRTPLNLKLSVPRHVKHLYVTSPMREMRVLPVGDVNISDKNLFASADMTRVSAESVPYEVPENITDAYYHETSPQVVANADINDKVINQANSFFPDGKQNISQEQVSTNTDLTMPADAEDDYLAVWLTYLGQGANDPVGWIWMYYYPSDQTDPKLDQITMVGLNDNGTFNEFTISGKGNPNYATPLVKTDNYPKDANGKPNTMI